MPVLSYLEPLDEDALRSILTLPKNALIKQYSKLFELEDIKLVMDDEVIDFIVQKAMEFQLGARGLRSICEAVMVDAMFELPSQPEVKEFHLTKEYVETKLNKEKIAKLKVVA